MEEQDYLDVQHQVPIIRVERPFTLAQTPTTRTEIVDCLITFSRYPQMLRKFFELRDENELIDIKMPKFNAAGTFRLFRHPASLGVLKIDDVLEFISSLEDLFEVFINNYWERYVGRDSPEAAVQRFVEICYDATPDDLRNWRNFSERRKQELLLGPIFPVHSKRMYHFLDRTILATSGLTLEAMEGYYSLSFNITKDLTEVSPLIFLPEVRYGLVSDREAVIYAIQNPLIFGHSSNSIRDTLAYFGSTEKTLSDLFSGKNLSFLKEDGHSIDEKKMSSAFADLDRSGVITKGMQFFGLTEDESIMIFDFLGHLSHKESLLAAAKQFEVNCAYSRSLTAELRKGLPDRVGRLRAVNGSSLVSLMMSVLILHENGIRSIKIPMSFPERAHFFDPEIEQRILENNQNLIDRFCFEMESIELVRQNGFFEIKLPDKLLAKRIVFQWMFQH